VLRDIRLLRAVAPFRAHIITPLASRLKRRYQMARNFVAPSVPGAPRVGSQQHIARKGDHP